MKPLVPFLTLISGVGVGMLIEWRRGFATAAPTSDASAGVGRSGMLPEEDEVQAEEEKTSRVVLPSGQDSPKLTALLVAFDPRNPVESQITLLERIMGASKEDLAEMVRGMTGEWRNIPGWQQARTAAVQRWVYLAPDEAVAWAAAAQKAGEFSNLGAEIFGMLAEADPTRALAEAQRLANPSLKNRAIQSVIGSISQADPEQAFRLCQSLSAEQRRSIYGNAYNVLFGNWADRDPTAAAAASLTLKDPNERGEASSTVMHRWAAQDPAGALAWAKGLTESGMRQGALQSYFGTLGARDPETAIAQISEFPRFQQHGLLSNLVGSWMQSDPEAASAWVLARPNAVERQRLIIGASENLGSMAGHQASKLVVQLVPGAARDQAIKQVVDQWMWSDPDAAVAFTKTLPALEGIKLREQVAQGLAYRNPAKAIAFLTDNPIDNPASEVWGTLAGAMARADSPAQALDWANSLPDEISRRKALPAIFAQMVRDNPAEAAKQAAALPDEATRLECLSTVAGAWATAGMEEALAWAKGLTGNNAEAAMGAVLQKGAPYQPTVAAAQLDAMMSRVAPGTKPADALMTAAGTIATAYFAENEHAAARWAASLPQDDARAAAVNSLAAQWAQYDPAGASEWIGTLPGGKPRDAAVGQLVGKIIYTDPAAAFAWSSTVNDEGERAKLLGRTFTSWRQLDAPAARTAIQATDWSDQEKTKWLDKVK